MRCAVGNTPRCVSSVAASSRVICRYHRNQRLGEYTRDSPSRSKRPSIFVDPRTFARRRSARRRVACLQPRRVRCDARAASRCGNCSARSASQASPSTAGVPAFRSFLLDARLTADVNGWVLAVQLARSEAAKRGRPVMVCGTADTQRCAGPRARRGLDGLRQPRRRLPAAALGRRAAAVRALGASSRARSSATGPTTSFGRGAAQHQRHDRVLRRSRRGAPRGPSS